MAKLAIDVVLNKAAAMTGLRGMEKDITSFGKAALGLAGLGGGLVGFVAGIDSILAKAGQLQDVSDAFNISAESIQRLAAVGVTANLSIEEIGSKLGKLGKAAQDAAGGNTELAKTFAKIGVTGQDLVRLNPEQLFNKLRIAVSSGSLANEQFKITSDLLARDYQRFMPILMMATEEFERLGGGSAVMSDAMVASLDAANVTLRTFQNQVFQTTSLVAGSFLDLVAVFKDNPLLLLEPMGDNVDKALKEREEKIRKGIENERKMRAGIEKAVTDQSESDRNDVNFVRQKVKLIDAEIAAIDKAFQMLADSDEKRTKEDLANFKQAEKEKRDLIQKRAELIPQIQDLEAQRQGSGAEMKLLEQRAAAASAQARISGGAEDVFNAQKLAVELQKSKEQAFNQAGFGDQSFSRAKASTEAIVGAIPQASQLRDIPSSTEAQRTQPVKLENPPNLQGIMDKLDRLIANAGVFS
jgi:hypothetical protein